MDSTTHSTSRDSSGGIAFIGLGAMGRPMASRLLQTGHRLIVRGNRDPSPMVDLSAAGASVADTPREAAEYADVVITMVRDEEQTEAVVLGADGAIEGLRPGGTLVVMSTLSAEFCRRLATECERRDVGFLDAPVSGGVHAAADGRLCVMVGGADEVFERNRLLLQVLGDPVLHMGHVGAGQITKIVNNAIKIGVLGLATEGLSLGVRAGLDLEALLSALCASSARSHVLENWSYYYRFKIEHRPGGPLEILHKDIGFAMELAESLGVNSPLVRCASTVDVGRLLDDKTDQQSSTS